MLSFWQNPEALEKYRYELKIPLEQSQLIEFKHRLRQLGLHPKRAFPGRQINSVYFDSHDMNDYIDNVSGIADRCKTRIRWYNEDISRLMLELKIKKNKASFKEALKLENSEKHDPRLYADVCNIMSSQRETTEKILLQDVFPVLEVQYEREYFMLNQHLRMTMDVNQKFRRLYPRPTKDMTKSPVFCVVEFKFPAEKRAEVQAMMRNLPFRIFRHSKYVIGMDVVAP